MARQKRYITFYHLQWQLPPVKAYGLMCSRSWWKCFKLGMRHICQGKALFFTIERI